MNTQDAELELKKVVKDWCSTTGRIPEDMMLMLLRILKDRSHCEPRLIWFEKKHPCDGCIAQGKNCFVRVAGEE